MIDVAMKAGELRIGNFIKCKNRDDFYCEVNEIYPTGLHVVRTFNDGEQDDQPENIERFEGIPITLEWLKRLGFDDKDYKEGYIGIERKINMQTEFVLTKPEIGYYENFRWQYKTHFLSMFCELKYVHELQNLFYVLTGNELHLSK